MKTGGNSFSSSIVRCVRLNTIVRWRERGSRAKCTYPSVNRDVRVRAVFCRSDLEPDAFNELLSVVGISCTVIGGFSSVFHGSELSRYHVLASCFVRVAFLFFIFSFFFVIVSFQLVSNRLYDSICLEQRATRICKFQWLKSGNYQVLFIFANRYARTCRGSIP